ncbi:hypothetical protein ETB97_005773 [Aspergillus alliaceus]|uniref:Ankyrin repeat-containing domain protein n=1 Tax=Petromyces alliaceus TaxID=209559 RepID=A0A8H5ZW52_PETAA|nr:hypothetical protein ETB97_005773 [Aspergillus burnettii]
MLCDPYDRSTQIWLRVYEDYPISTKDVVNWTSLCFAVYLGLKQHAHVMLEEGAEINKGRDTPLQIVTGRGYEEILGMLLNNGADPSGEGELYYAALRGASSNGHQHAVEMLLDHGAVVNEQSGNRTTALQLAAEGGYEGIVKILRNQEADINMQGKWHDTYGTPGSGREWT